MLNLQAYSEEDEAKPRGLFNAASQSYRIVDFGRATTIDRCLVDKLVPKDEEFIPKLDYAKKIDDFAFVFTKIKKLVAPDFLKHIGQYAFFGCQSLEEVYTSNVEYIGDYAFEDCYRKLSKVEVGSSIKYIGEDAFYGCSKVRLKVLKRPEVVKSMLTWPFGVRDTTKISYGTGSGPLLCLAWNMKKRILDEAKLNIYQSMVYASPEEDEAVCDFTKYARLENKDIRPLAGGTSRRIRPILGYSLSALASNGFSSYRNIVNLNGLDKAEVLGKSVLDNAKVQQDVVFGCKVLSAEALKGFTQSDAMFNELCYIGKHAFEDGLENVVFNGDVLSAADFAFDRMKQSSVEFPSAAYLSYWSFGRSAFQPSCNTEMSAFFKEMQYLDLEQQEAFPFGLRVENIFAEERQSTSGALVLSEDLKLHALKSGGQAYYKRSSSNVDLTDKIQFTRHMMDEVVCRFSLDTTEEINLVFSSKLLKIDKDAFSSCEKQPIVHAEEQIMKDIN